MRLLVSSTIAAAVGIAGAMGAQAADIARPTYQAPVAVIAPVYNWSGFYFGGNLGWAFGKSSATYLPTGVSFEVGKDAFMAGGQAGFNWQAGAFVFGIEGEINWIDGQSDRTTSGGFSGWGGTDSVATLAGRFGFAANNVLWYGKGGAGWVRNTVSINNGLGGVWEADKTNVGWLVGAGVEVGWTPNWTTKIEYNYIGLDSLTGQPGFLNGDSVTVKRDIQLLKVGVNYKF